jgi:hypothetical protein
MLNLIVLRNILNAPVMRKINASPGGVVKGSGFGPGYAIADKFPSQIKRDSTVINRLVVVRFLGAREKYPAQNEGQANEKILHLLDFTGFKVKIYKSMMQILHGKEK